MYCKVSKISDNPKHSPSLKHCTNIKLFLTTPLWGRYESVTSSYWWGNSSQYYKVLADAARGFPEAWFPDSQRPQKYVVLKQNISLIKNLPTSLKMSVAQAKAVGFHICHFVNWLSHSPFEKIRYSTWVLWHAQTCIFLFINLLIPFISTKGGHFPVRAYLM